MPPLPRRLPGTSSRPGIDHANGERTCETVGLETEVLRRIGLAIAILLALAACGDDLPSGPPGLGGPPTGPLSIEVRKQTDEFELRITGAVNLSTTLNHVWRHTGTMAIVSHSADPTSGTAVLTVRDDGGATVYQAVLGSYPAPITVTGHDGLWSIRVVLDRFSGSAGVQARTSSPPLP